MGRAALFLAEDASSVCSGILDDAALVLRLRLTAAAFALDADARFYTLLHHTLRLEACERAAAGGATPEAVAALNGAPTRLFLADLALFSHGGGGTPGAGPDADCHVAPRGGTGYGG